MANFKISNILPDSLVPKDIPKGLILTLIIVIMLMSLSAYRYGNGDTVQGMLHVLENWVLYLVLIQAVPPLSVCPSNTETTALMCGWRII